MTPGTGCRPRGRAAAPLLVAPLLAALALACVGAPDASALATPAGPPAGVIAAYSLAAPVAEVPSGIVVRAVLAAGAGCPTLTVVMADGARPALRSVRMAERSAPATTMPAFAAIAVCSAPVPVGAAAALVDGHRLPARMPARVDRLALLGDSGCRIASWQVQDCTSSSSWPLARISQSVADERPDAVVVNGDFFYREAGCPSAEQAQCGSSPPPVAGLPFTDSAYGWLADALLPMAPMLGVAPIIVTRGNHEACNRAGNGYFLLFDPREGTQSACAPLPGTAGLVAPDTVPTDAYAIDLRLSPTRTLRLAVVDSAGGSDTQVTAFSALQRPAYEEAARLTAARPGRESWLLTHRPVYAYVSDTLAQPGAPFNPWGSADQTAASYGLLGNYDLVFSSHLHIAEAVQLPGYPGQLVLGNGGTLLDPATGYGLPAAGPVVGPDARYPAPSWAWMAPRFGYAIATPNAERGSWRIQMKDPSGGGFARCGLRSRQLYCADRHLD